MCSGKHSKTIVGSMLSEVSTCEQVKVNIRRWCRANALLTNLTGKLYGIAPVRNELTHDCDGVMLAHEQMASRIWLEIENLYCPEKQVLVTGFQQKYLGQEALTPKIETGPVTKGMWGGCLSW